jgi:HlyD family secretion protein
MFISFKANENIFIEERGMNIKKWIGRLKEVILSNKKIMGIGGGALAVVITAAVVLLPGNGDASQTQTIFVEAITGNISETIDVVGSLEAVPSITLAWESGGIIGPFDLQIGDQVEKDQVLLMLEDNSVSAEILQAQTDLLTAQIALENLLVSNTDLHTAAQELADLEYGLRDYKADRDYWNYKGTSWDVVEEARANYYAAEQVRWEKEAAYNALLDLETDDPIRMDAYEVLKEAIQESDNYHRWLSNHLGVYYDHAVETDFIEYDNALGEVEQARNAYKRYIDQTDEIAAAEAQVQALQNTIDKARIVAPFAGTITEINAVSGELVANGDTAVRVDNLAYLMVDVYVSEIDINKVKAGQPAVLTFDALPNEEFRGMVASISSAGTDDNGVVEFRVRVVVVEPDATVMPGFTAVVSIITSEEADALLVPTQAIQTSNGQPVVTKMDADGTMQIIAVELGAASDQYTQILSGEIASGDVLAVTITSQTADSGLPMDGSMMRQLNQVTGNGGGSREGGPPPEGQGGN